MSTLNIVSTNLHVDTPNTIAISFSDAYGSSVIKTSVGISRKLFCSRFDRVLSLSLPLSPMHPQRLQRPPGAGHFSLVHHFKIPAFQGGE